MEFLAHWNNSPQVDMSLHSDILSWVLANQSLLCCSASLLKQQSTGRHVAPLW
jgi:hypothetical protein